jgi:hypothetical protein
MQQPTCADLIHERLAVWCFLINANLFMACNSAVECPSTKKGAHWRRWGRNRIAISFKGTPTPGSLPLNLLTWVSALIAVPATHPVGNDRPNRERASPVQRRCATVLEMKEA